MLNRTIALKINRWILALAGVIDFIRGYLHTFKVRYAAVEKAGIEPTSDSLVLMSAFGMSNFLTAFLFFLILWKAPKLAPYVLLIIPVSYFLGSTGMRMQQVTMESPFVGQYMMRIYLTVCLISALLFFWSRNKSATVVNP